VWFRAAIGKRKNAEARWLLPMICRRGGIDKSDIGAIRIMDTTTEFEISKEAAESFALKIKRPDKEDNIRIQLLEDGPQAQAPAERHHEPRREAKAPEARSYDRSRDERGPKSHGKFNSEGKPGFDHKANFKKNKKHQDKPAHGGHQPHAGASPKSGFEKKSAFEKRPGSEKRPSLENKLAFGDLKPAFGKKKKKNRQG
jgi:ATP-dependent RNA helicase DeaD